MLGNAEAEVARFAEVALPQFIFLDFETALEDFFCFGAADGDVDGDFLVTANTEGSDGVSCFAYKTILSALPPSSM